MVDFKVPPTVPQEIKGESDVPLEFVKELTPREFMPTLTEWATTNRQQVIEVGDDQTSSGLIYTVPQGFDLFLTFLNISGFCIGSGISGNSFRAHIYMTNTNKSLISLRFDASQAQNSSVASNLSHPLKILSGETLSIFVTSGSNGHAEGIIQGWLEPKTA